MLELLITCFLVLLLSFPSHSAPSWVEGIRSGSETLRVTVGNKIFFRRIAGTSDNSKTEACDLAVKKAIDDIQNEFYLYNNIPYTVEILFYDEKYSDCATTVSVAQNIPEKYLKINEWKKEQKKKEKELNAKIKEAEDEKYRLTNKQIELENYIQKNQHIINEVNKLEQTVGSVEGIVRNRQEKAERFAITGLRKKEFEKATGETAQVIYMLESSCYKQFSTIKASIQGTIDICWEGSDYTGYSIVGYCNRSNRQCYTKDP